MRSLELTPRQRAILERIALGKNMADVARDLAVTPATVRNAMLAVCYKLGVTSRREAVLWAQRQGAAL